MAKTPDKLSPLHELAMPRPAEGETGVDLSERLCYALVQVQSWPDCAAKVAKILEKLRADAVVMNTGPGRWLIDSEDENLETELRHSIGPDLGAVTGLTHARVVVSISGEKSAWVLASGIAIDFDLKAFPVGTTKVSHHHEIGVTIHRAGENSFELYVFTSLVRSFWTWISRASEEVGYSVS